MPFEPSQPAIRTNEDILREIAGVFVVADESVAQLVDLALMALDDHVERLAISAERGADRRRIVHRGERARISLVRCGLDHAHLPASG